MHLNNMKEIQCTSIIIFQIILVPFVYIWLLCDVRKATLYTAWNICILRWPLPNIQIIIAWERRIKLLTFEVKIQDWLNYKTHYELLITWSYHFIKFWYI